MKKLKFAAAAVAFAMVPGVALANIYVYGSGYSLEAAMQAAEARGAAKASAVGTCYAPADPANCEKKSDGTWVCHVSVSEYNRKGGGVC